MRGKGQNLCVLSGIRTHDLCKVDGLFVYSFLYISSLGATCRLCSVKSLEERDEGAEARDP